MADTSSNSKDSETSRTGDDGDRATTGLPARGAALALLQAILRQGRTLEDASASNKKLGQLDSRDRNFVRMLVATTLRRLGQIDALIGTCVNKPLPVRAAVVEDILRLGVCQLVFLGTPAHAAVDSMVAMTELAGHGRLKGLVNAVLRRLAREGADAAEAQDAPRLNTPNWLWQSWQAAYGEASCRKIAAAHLEEPPLDITVRRDPDAWAEVLSAMRLPTGSLRRPAGGAIAALRGYDEGAWWVQDAGAAIPAQLMGEVAGQRVLDLCAAPGGKTAQLAARGADVVAVDRAASRLQRVEENLTRLGLTAEAVCADVLHWRPRAPEKYVLLDAPCTATGTIRRHPDIARLKGPDDMARLISLQTRLLDAAVEMTAPGGLLVFVTCSLQPEEGPERIAALLAAGAPVARVPIDPKEVGGLGELLTAEGDLRTLPCHLAGRGGIDGFYAARLRRR